MNFNKKNNNNNNKNNNNNDKGTADGSNNRKPEKKCIENIQIDKCEYNLEETKSG